MKTIIISVTHKPSTKWQYVAGQATKELLKQYKDLKGVACHGRVRTETLENGSCVSSYKFIA